jgi:hypothetical protein
MAGGRHRGWHGYEGPVKTTHHAAKHDSQMSAIDNEQDARNRGSSGASPHVGGGGRGGVATPPSREERSTGRTGGSARAVDLGNKAKGGGHLDGGLGKLKQAAGGSVDSPKNRQI